VNLANLDLNLLVSLDALLDQRSVTRAAQQLGLSQPALSASLARLRRHFGDELLSRVGNSYRLTPLATQLKPRVRLALDGVERVFTAQPDFDPAESTREFSVLVSDYGCAVLGDTLAQLMAEEAPGARLRLAHNTPDAVDQAQQTLLNTDLMVLPHGFVTDLPHADLHRDRWVLVVSADNAAVDDEMTVEQLETMPWVATYHGPTASTPAARQMRMLGIEPRVQVVTESFLTVPGLVAGSDRIALLQERLVGLLPLDVGIRALPLPFDAGPLVEAMWWHPLYDGDPEHAFFRDLVLRAAHRATEPVGGVISRTDTAHQGSAVP
jgi:DNA-binding transcriptional LysR family regulator